MNDIEIRVVNEYGLEKMNKKEINMLFGLKQLESFILRSKTDKILVSNLYQLQEL